MKENEDINIEGQLQIELERLQNFLEKSKLNLSQSELLLQKAQDKSNKNKKLIEQQYDEFLSQISDFEKRIDDIQSFSRNETINQKQLLDKELKKLDSIPDIDKTKELLDELKVNQEKSSNFVNDFKNEIQTNLSNLEKRINDVQISTEKETKNKVLENISDTKNKLKAFSDKLSKNGIDIGVLTRKINAVTTNQTTVVYKLEKRINNIQEIQNSKINKENFELLSQRISSNEKKILEKNERLKRNFLVISLIGLAVCIIFIISQYQNKSLKSINNQLSEKTKNIESQLREKTENIESQLSDMNTKIGNLSKGTTPKPYSSVYVISENCSLWNKRDIDEEAKRIYSCSQGEKVRIIEKINNSIYHVEVNGHSGYIVDVYLGGL